MRECRRNEYYDSSEGRCRRIRRSPRENEGKGRGVSEWGDWMGSQPMIEWRDLSIDQRETPIDSLTNYFDAVRKGKIFGHVDVPIGIERRLLNELIRNGIVIDADTWERSSRENEGKGLRTTKGICDHCGRTNMTLYEGLDWDCFTAGMTEAERAKLWRRWERSSRENEGW